MRRVVLPGLAARLGLASEQQHKVAAMVALALPEALVVALVVEVPLGQTGMGKSAAMEAIPQRVAVAEAALRTMAATARVERGTAVPAAMVAVVRVVAQVARATALVETVRLARVAAAVVETDRVAHQLVP